jgi:predicted nucleotidyltransferase
MEVLTGLDSRVQRSLQLFVDTAKTALEDDLQAVVLFGSAAEGQLRPMSDVNLLLVLKRFDRVRVDRLREPYRTARATIRLGAMFVLETELPNAMACFAVKFVDIVARHRVLWGPDPFAGLAIERVDVIRRLEQDLLNLRLRLRQSYVLTSLREEQLSVAIADAAGPLRVAAAALLGLEGRKAESPKAALALVAAELGPEWPPAVTQISEAREQAHLPAGAAPALMLRLIELTGLLAARLPRAK